MKSNNIYSKIEVERLGWKPNNQDKFILEDINCEFEKGNFYGIIGPNGSGKTSLVKNIIRFIESTKGEIRLDNLDIKEYKRKDIAKKIALVSQNTNLDCTFSAYDIVMMGRSLYQKRFSDESQRDKDMVKDAMIMADCYELRNKDVSLLSGGERQRVITARAIAQDTPWLILDEPSSSLDVRHQLELMTALVQLNKEKDKTIIAVLHDINMAAKYCNRIIMLKEGKICFQGKKEDILTKENLAKVYDVEFKIIKDSESEDKYFVPTSSI